MAKKVKTAYVCQHCGYDSAKWQGKCPACEQWNTFVEEIVSDKDDRKKGEWRAISGMATEGRPNTNKPQPISAITYSQEKRIITHDQELNRVLGGGIVPGAVVLIGGEPGIGKSTLMLQIALMLTDYKVLYVSGEESAQQIKMRAERLPFSSENCAVLTETSTENIFTQLSQLNPDILIIDSIQTLSSPYIESAAGSVSQVKECTAELIKFAKETHTPTIVVGHITKDGSLAGPKVLEHMVDTVLQFEGDRHMSYRILRTTKNRFGSTSELGIYEMVATGLRQVSNPSEILLSQREEQLTGVGVATIMEGNRPLLVEVQSLVTPSVYGNPQRSSTGFDAKRLNMLLAVLEKRGGYKLNFSDVFLNITGGIKVEDPSIDLAVCASLISSHQDIVIPSTTCFAAEIGLGGEVRAVSRIENRIMEADKLGFERIFISKYSAIPKKERLSIEVVPISRLQELNELLF